MFILYEENMFKIKLTLALITLFVVIFYIIDIANHITIFHNHPLKLEFFLTVAFFILSVLLITITYKIIEKREISKIKYKIVSNISHELRTYITSVSGALTIILNDLVGEIPTSMKEMVSIANSNTTKLIELVNNLVNTEKL